MQSVTNDQRQSLKVGTCILLFDLSIAGMSSRLRAKVPSATYINYDTFKISQMNLEDNPDEEVKPDQGQQGQCMSNNKVYRSLT